MKKIYLDYSASTPVDRDVIDAMLPYYRENFGNPSSTHSTGQEAKAVVENSRNIIASCLGANPFEIIFTGSGTESNNLAIKGFADANKDKGNHIIISSIEHYSVLETALFLKSHGYTITILPVDSMGLIDPDDVKKSITDKTILLSIMHANNEIGTIQPTSEISQITKKHEICFHVDAVQSFGHIPFTVDMLGIDLLSISAHKLYGPKGSGALYIRKESVPFLLPLLHGGGQESGMRSSTHNVPGIVGLSKAAEIAKKKIHLETDHILKLRDKLINKILDTIENTMLNGHPTKRLPGNANISFAGIKSDVMLLSLDMKGIACSSGSACHSSTVEPSHVLQAIRLESDMAESSIRLSIGRDTTEKEIDYIIEILKDTSHRLRRMNKS